MVDDWRSFPTLCKRTKQRVSVHTTQANHQIPKTFVIFQSHPCDVDVDKRVLLHVVSNFLSGFLDKFFPMCIIVQPPKTKTRKKKKIFFRYSRFLLCDWQFFLIDSWLCTFLHQKNPIFGPQVSSETARYLQIIWGNKFNNWKLVTYPIYLNVVVLINCFKLRDSSKQIIFFFYLIPLFFSNANVLRVFFGALFEILQTNPLIFTKWKMFFNQAIQMWPIWNLNKEIYSLFLKSSCILTLNNIY